MNALEYAILIGTLSAGLAACGPDTQDNNLNNGPGTNNTTGTNNDIGNRPPVADAGVNQTVEVGDFVRLSAAASSDPDNDLLTVEWLSLIHI